MPALNFWKFQRGINLTPQSVAPSSPTNGDLYYDSSTNRFTGYMNGAFVSIPGISTTDILSNKTLAGPTFTGQLSLPNGTVAAPTLLFSSAGIYSSSAQNIDFSVNGVQTVNFNASTAIIRTNLQIQDGTAASPGLNFQNDPTTGLYRVSAGTIGISTSGTLKGSISSAGLWNIGELTGTQAHVINGASLTLTPSSGTGRFSILRGNTNGGELSLGANTAFNDGGEIILYGSTHASKANFVEFQNGGLISGRFDASGHLNLLGQRELRLQDTTGGEYVGLRASSTQTTYTITLPSAAPATNAGLKYDGANYIWSLAGDVSGPVSSTDTAVAKFSGTTGKILQDTGVLIDSLNSVTMNRLALGGSALSSTGILNNSPTAVQNPLSGVTQRAFRTSMVGTSAATTEIVGFSSAVSTDAAAFTTTLRTHFQSVNLTKGAGSTITTDLAFGGSIPTQGTNNALLADNTAFTGSWVINSSSTSASLFSGPMEWKQQATPSNPAAGNNRIYFKADGNLYKLTSAGVETAFAAGGSGDLNQGGNSFGTTLTLGTNDAFDLAFETNGVTKGSVTSAGAWTLGASTGVQAHVINGASLALTASSSASIANILRGSSTTGALSISGGSVFNDGGEVILYGSAHASKANIVEFQTGGSIKGSISSTGAWTLGASAFTGTHTLNANAVRILPGSGVESVLSAKADNTGILSLTGASGSGNGGVLILYGNSHATKANIIEFNTAATLKGSIDSTGAWTLGPSGHSGLQTLNANNVRILPGSGTESVLSAKADGAGSLALTGTTGSANGAVILLYGNFHATKANVIEFNTAATRKGSISSAGLWTIGESAGTQAHVVNGGLDVANDLKVTTAGKGLFVKEGSNAKMGVSTLVAGAVTVTTTAVTATSRIFLTSQADGGTPGFQRITARTAATSFVITSSNAADTSDIAWMIVEPA